MWEWYEIESVAGVGYIEGLTDYFGEFVGCEELRDAQLADRNHELGLKELYLAR